MSSTESIKEIKEIGIKEIGKESIKVQEEKIRTLLQKHVHRIINRESEAFVDFLEILMEQDKWLDKLDNVYAFKITRSKTRSKTKALLLQVKVYNCNKWLTISWRNGTITKRKEPCPLQSAFRQAIRTQIQKWRRCNLDKKCVLCDKTTSLQVDHKEPSFIELTKKFNIIPINTRNMPLLFDYHYKYGKKFSKEDSLFKIRWQKYHKQNASFQWLCKKCNLSKGKKSS